MSVLPERSVDVLDWIARVGAATTPQVARAVGMKRSGAYHHTTRLRQLGYVAAAGSSLLVPTREGVAEVGRAWVGRTRMVPAQWEHATAVADVAAWLSAHPDVTWWRSEREQLTTAAPEGHDPRRWDAPHRVRVRGKVRQVRRRADLVAEIAGAVTAIEVERTRKSDARIVEIVSAWGAALTRGDVERVLWLAGSPYVERVLRDAREEGKGTYPALGERMAIRSLDELPAREAPSGHIGTGGHPNAEMRPPSVADEVGA